MTTTPGDPDRPPGPIERARTELDRGPSVGWEEGSSYGYPGSLGRRALQRALRPYTVRRRGFDEALVDALELADHRLALERLAAVATVPPDGAVDVETDAGQLWMDETDRLITPLVQDHPTWEGDVTRFVTAALRPGSTFVDVGANVGYFSVLASCLVGRSGLVVAIEPDPRTCDFLRANLWRHGCANVVVVPAAVGVERGSAWLVHNSQGRAGSWTESSPAEGAIAVPCTRLDELLAGLTVDVLKVDIEQREHLAIAGASAVVRANPSLVVVCEFWPHASELPGGLGPDDVLASYESMGLELRRLQSDGSHTATSAVDLRSDDVILTNIVLRGPRAPT
jgi:FkbM family methyltransferase